LVSAAVGFGFGVLLSAQTAGVVKTSVELARSVKIYLKKIDTAKTPQLRKI